MTTLLKFKEKIINFTPLRFKRK